MIDLVTPSHDANKTAKKRKNSSSTRRRLRRERELKNLQWYDEEESGAGVGQQRARSASTSRSRSRGANSSASGSNSESSDDFPPSTTTTTKSKTVSRELSSFSAPAAAAAAKQTRPSSTDIDGSAAPTLRQPTAQRGANLFLNAASGSSSPWLSPSKQRQSNDSSSASAKSATASASAAAVSVSPLASTKRKHYQLVVSDDDEFTGRHREVAAAAAVARGGGGDNDSNDDSGETVSPVPAKRARLDPIDGDAKVAQPPLLPPPLHSHRAVDTARARPARRSHQNHRLSLDAVALLDSSSDGSGPDDDDESDSVSNDSSSDDFGSEDASGAEDVAAPRSAAGPSVATRGESNMRGRRRSTRGQVVGGERAQRTEKALRRLAQRLPSSSSEESPDDAMFKQRDTSPVRARQRNNIRRQQTAGGGMMLSPPGRGSSRLSGRRTQHKPHASERATNLRLANENTTSFESVPKLRILGGPAKESAPALRPAAPISVRVLQDSSNSASAPHALHLADIDPVGKGDDPAAVTANLAPFSLVGGVDDHVRKLQDMVVLPLLYPDVFADLGVDPPRGVLFWGPPGTGKTLVARELARACSIGQQKVTFFMRNGADVLSKWVGEAERQLKLLFEEAKQNQPSVIFFDEIDGLAPVRSSKQDHIHSSIVSTLLALMDGLERRGNVIVIGATNRPDAVDPALRRPGRFDREFRFKLPDATARKSILMIAARNHLSGQVGSDAAGLQRLLDEIAQGTTGWSGADLSSLFTEASLVCLKRTRAYALPRQERIRSLTLQRSDFAIAAMAVSPSHARWSLGPGASGLLDCASVSFVAPSEVHFDAVSFVRLCCRRLPSTTVRKDLSTSSVFLRCKEFASGLSLGVARSEDGSQECVDALRLYGVDGRQDTFFRDARVRSLLADAKRMPPQGDLLAHVPQARRRLMVTCSVPTTRIPRECLIQVSRSLLGECRKWLPDKPCILELDSNDLHEDDPGTWQDIPDAKTPEWLSKSTGHSASEQAISLEVKLDHLHAHLRGELTESCLVVIPDLASLWAAMSERVRSLFVDSISQCAHERVFVIAFWAPLENSSTSTPLQLASLFEGLGGVCEPWSRVADHDLFEALITKAVLPLVIQATSHEDRDFVTEFWKANQSFATPAKPSPPAPSATTQQIESAHRHLRTLLRRVIQELTDFEELGPLFRGPSPNFVEFYNKFPNPLSLSVVSDRITDGHYVALSQFVADIDALVGQYTCHRSVAPELLTSRKRRSAMLLRDQTEALLEELCVDELAKHVRLCQEVFESEQKSAKQVPETVAVLITAKDFGSACQDFVQAVIDHPDSWPFRQPVDRDIATDYDEVIEQPIDLTVIMARAVAAAELSASSGLGLFDVEPYGKLSELRSDIRLMCANAQLYNAATTEYYRCAQRLQQEFLSAETLDRFFPMRDKKVATPIPTPPMSSAAGDSRSEKSVSATVSATVLDAESQTYASLSQNSHSDWNETQATQEILGEDSEEWKFKSQVKELLYELETGISKDDFTWSKLLLLRRRLVFEVCSEEATAPSRLRQLRQFVEEMIRKNAY